MLRGEKTKQIWHQGDIQNGDDAHMKRAAQLSWFARDFLEKILQLPQDGAGVFLEDQAGGSEEDALAPALEERHPQSRFQVAHLLGNARLGNPEAVRGAAEAAGLSYREEVTQMANLQRVVHCGKH